MGQDAAKDSILRQRNLLRQNQMLKTRGACKYPVIDFGQAINACEKIQECQHKMPGADSNGADSKSVTDVQQPQRRRPLVEDTTWRIHNGDDEG